MKRLFSTAVAAILGMAAFAGTPGVRDVVIDVALQDDGTAYIHESWTLTADHGTEWYLVRENLGDISIYDFDVREGSLHFVNEDAWDVDRTLEAKAGKCGIVKKTGGLELCWGLGSYGDHTFEVSYKMRNAAKALDDYDIFHIQLLSDRLSSPPEHVKATVSVSGKTLTTENVRMWGFGFLGDSRIEDGAVVYESSEALSYDSSLIALIRFDKGIINPTSILNSTFDEVSRKAFKGSEYQREKTPFEKFIDAVVVFFSKIIVFLALFLIIFIPIKINRKRIMDILGVRKKAEVGWSREVPYGGDLASADYILGRLGEKRQGNFVASAMILRMIQKGCLAVRQDPKGRTEITFGDRAALDSFGPAEKKLWAFMKEASGEDQILQNKEFSRWSRNHTEEINSWLTEVSLQGDRRIQELGLKSDGRYTPEGQAEARKALGLKKFLSDYTLIRERASREVTLWQDYLVFGAMFGIADKVAAELKDINPTMFEEAVSYSYPTMRNVIYMSDNLAGSITSAKSRYDAAHAPSASSSAGLGGHTSFGGGGGFAGGGHGGGCR